MRTMKVKLESLLRVCIQRDRRELLDCIHALYGIHADRKV